MKRIVITDDDPGIQDIFKIIFKSAGYEATILSSGEPILNNEIETPDIFLLDKQLCGSDGLDICRFLKARSETKNIPVILISANSSPETAGENAEADEVVRKPFRIHELLSVVSKHLQKSAA